MHKIAIDARRLRQSTGRYTREMLNALQETDSINQYHVIIHTKDQTHWTPKAKNFYLHVVPYDHYTFGEQIGFARFLYQLKPDLVHFTMPQQPLLYFGKRVTTIHDLTLVRFKNLDKNRFIYALEQTIFKFLLKNVARRSKKIMVHSNYVKKDLASYANINASKITVAKDGAANLSRLTQQPVNILRRKDFIFFVGNAFPHKNLDRLIEAFEKLQEKYPNLHLALAGKREFFYNQLEDKYHAVSNLHFLGFVSDEQLAWMYSHAKAYVFPSLSEGFGLPGIDVMQHDLPLISSNATCLPEIYGDAAHYFDPNSTESIAQSIDEVLRSKTRREMLIKNGREQVKKYSWQDLAQKTHKAYLDVLGK